jgi:hypothetical protein
MEKHPLAVFQERELESYDAAEFERLKSERLVRRQRGVRAGDSYRDASGRHLTAVASPDGNLEAIDDEDPEFDAVSVSPADSGSWQVDMDAVCSRFRARNDLGGPSGALHERILQLGETSPSNAVFLALLADKESGLSLLKAIPSLASQAYSEIFVICPSFQVQPSERRALESLGIKTSVIDDRDPLLLPAWPPHPSTMRTGGDASEPEFEHSPENRWVNLRGRRRTLPPTANGVIAILHNAYRRGHPDMHWKQIVSDLDVKPASIHDVFKRVPDWQELVASPRKGVFRLNLPD